MSPVANEPVPAVYVVFALVPDSAKPHPAGVVLEVPVEARVSKFCVTAVLKLEILIGVEVSAETFRLKPGISTVITERRTNDTSKPRQRWRKIKLNFFVKWFERVDLAVILRIRNPLRFDRFETFRTFFERNTGVKTYEAGRWLGAFYQFSNYRSSMNRVCE